MALAQILDLVALNVISLRNLTATERHLIIVDLLTRSIAASSTQHIADVSLFHGARDGEFMESRFRLWRMRFNRITRTWTDEELVLTETESYFVHLDGTGASHVKRFASTLENSSSAGTSRAAMYAFTQSLHSGVDPFSGGAPQLVGLWRKGLARQFGFCWNGNPYVAGMQVPATIDFAQLDWFNHLFERCDGRTGSKLAGAQSHRASLAPRKKGGTGSARR
jgi:hypothetical protein